MGIISPGFEFLAIPQLLNWSNEIEGLKSEQVWLCVFTNLYKLSNHFKLIQHQYKMFMMIATSRYMRHKMKIENSYECIHCHAGTVETLKHIYLDCPHSQNFYAIVENVIKNKIDRHHVKTKLNQFSCHHENIAISYMYLTANWYVGRKFQYGKQLYWDEFYKYLKMWQVGEKTALNMVLRDVIAA